MSPLAMLLIFLVHVPQAASDTEQLADDLVAKNETTLEENAACTTSGNIAAQVSEPTASFTRQLSRQLSSNSEGSPSARSVRSTSGGKVASFTSNPPSVQANSAV